MARDATLVAACAAASSSGAYDGSRTLYLPMLRSRQAWLGGGGPIEASEAFQHDMDCQVTPMPSLT